jgi:Peptidase MA superfamily
VGRLTRRMATPALVAPLLAASLLALGPEAVAAFDGFGESSADSTYGQEIRFQTELDGGQPDRLELLIRTPGADGSLVIPVVGSGSAAEYVWDTSVDHVVPNTLVTYQWRAIDGDEVVLSGEERIRYVDDRPGLDWQSVQLGEATVHWYGEAEGQAMRFGEVSAVGVERAEQLLGTELAGPVDVFVYETREDFFGALGPGAREWTGAAAYADLRTIFMWNSAEAGSAAYLETAMVHEITHIVFHDATDNPFHEPARWLNEGIATWSETREASGERAIVEREAAGDGLFSFEAISEQFPIGQRGGRLSYAQGTTMVDKVIAEHGPEAIARIAEAYREGASDEEALEAGTGVPADELYAAFFSDFGVDEPSPIEPEPIAASNVDRPTAGTIDPGGVDPDAEPPPAEAAPGEDRPSTEGIEVVVIVGLGIGLVAAAVGAVAMTRRAGRRPSS